MSLSVAICLDESGSMRELVDDVITGFNQYLRDLQQVDEDIRLTLNMFSSPQGGGQRVRTFYEGTVGNMPELETRDYRPRGQTPLCDAVYMSVQALESDDADAKLVVVQTDGKENDSYRYSFGAVRSVVRQKTEEGWASMYIGVGQRQDEVEEIARRLGMPVGSAISVSRAATIASFNAISRATEQVARREL